MRFATRSKWAAVALLAVAGMTAPSLLAGSTATPVAIGHTAPAFSLEDQDGKTVKLSDYAGKVIVLEWTNPQCPVVQRHYQAKTMTSLYEKYAPKGVVWLAINSSKNTTNADDKTWSKQNKLAYPVLNDVTGATGHAYGAKSTPHMFVIDKNGNLVYRGGIDNDPQGDMTEGKTNYVSKALDEVLADKAVSTAETAHYGCPVHYAD